jgi:hypothetical protein
MIRPLILTSLLLLPALVAAAAPPPYTAEYQMRRNGQALGTATVVYRAMPGGRFEFHTTSTGNLAGIISATVDERSVLRWNEMRPETISYSYKQDMPFSSRTRGLQVDAATGRIQSQDKDRRFSMPYQPGVIDRNAVTVALMSDVAAGRTGDLNYLVPSKGEVESQVYRVAGSETLRTALGQQRVSRVERIRESSNGRTTTLWLGQDRNFVPLRMLQREPEGDTIEMRIISIR